MKNFNGMLAVEADEHEVLLEVLGLSASVEFDERSLNEWLDMISKVAHNHATRDTLVVIAAMAMEGLRQTLGEEPPAGLLEELAELEEIEELEFLEWFAEKWLAELEEKEYADESELPELDVREYAIDETLESLQKQISHLNERLKIAECTILEKSHGNN
jgi:hypothetical protein